MKSRGMGFYICICNKWGGFRIDTGYGLRIVLGWFAIAFTSYDIDWVFVAMAKELEQRS